MEPAVGPRLLETFLTFRLKDLDGPTKASLRLCSKHLKAIFDATIRFVRVAPGDLIELLDCSWNNLWTLYIMQKAGQENSVPSPRAFKALLFALVSKFPSLIYLALDHCTTFETLPTNIPQLSHLRKLYINSTAFKAFPPSFGQLTALKALKILGCDALTVKGLAPLKHLKHLKFLEINRQPVTNPSFPTWLFDNITTSLEDLRLTGLKSLPPAIGKFKHLTSLILNEIAFTKVPEAIGSLTALRNLWLYGYHVILPASFSSLTALENLFLSADMDSTGPLQHLTGLKWLFFGVGMNETRPYPRFLWKMTSLTSLVLGHHRLDQLPVELGDLKQLQFLKLSMPSLQEISSIGALHALTALQMLNLSQLQALPTTLGINLTLLETLALNACSSLQTLPGSIDNLQKLKHLEIINCPGFSSLPSSIGNLKSLECLYLVRCAHITELPETIGRLGALKELRVNQCSSFTTIPDSFADLIWGKAYGEWPLKLVNFDGCPNLSFSPKIKHALDFVEYHRVYKKEIKEYTGLIRPFTSWSTSYW